MEISHTTTGGHNNGDFHHIMIDSALLLASGIFELLSKQSADDVYKWFFRALSCISLALVIYINWSKAVKIFNNKRNKDGSI